MCLNSRYYELQRGVMPQQQCRVSPQAWAGSDLPCPDSVCTLQPGTISSNPEQFSAQSSQKCSRAPNAIGQCLHRPGLMAAKLATLPGCAGLTLYFWTEPFLHTLSLRRGKIAQSPFVEPSFGKMFLDLHSRHEKVKEALVRTRQELNLADIMRGAPSRASCERIMGHETRILQNYKRPSPHVFLAFLKSI